MTTHCDKLTDSGCRRSNRLNSPAKAAPAPVLVNFPNNRLANVRDFKVKMSL
jgi:hypothetical protein